MDIEGDSKLIISQKVSKLQHFPFTQLLNIVNKTFPLKIMQIGAIKALKLITSSTILNNSTGGDHNNARPFFSG